MATFHTAGGGTYTLNSSIGSTDTTFTLSSFTEPVSATPYTMALLNTSIAYGTIGPKTSSSEFISFTGITQNSDGTATLTGVTRGLAKKYPFTTSSTFKLPHSGQSTFILSDVPQVFEKYAPVDNDFTFNGTVTFAIPPVGINPGGQPNASTTVSGIVQEATVTQVNNGTGTGSTGAVLFMSPADLASSNYGLNIPTAGQKAALVGDNTDIAVGSGNKYMTQTGYQKAAEIYGATATGNDTYVVTLSPAPTSYDNGRHYFVKLDVGNTGAATINFNGLGAVSIVTGLATALVTGDMVANGIYELIYNSTGPVFQLVNPASTVLTRTQYKSSLATYDLSTASAVFNIAHGLGTTPRFVELFVTHGTSAATVHFSDGSYDGSTNSHSRFGSDGAANADVANGDSTNGFYIATQATDFVTGIITTDATNIITTMTKNGSPTGTAYIHWKARA